MSEIFSFISKHDQALYVTLLLVVYVPTLYIFISSSDKQLLKIRFFSGIISIMQNTKEFQNCNPQILTLYRQVSEKYSASSSSYKSALALVEELIYYIDTMSDFRFKLSFRMKRPNEFRDRLFVISSHLKQQQPYASMSYKQNNLLTMMRHSVDSGNVDLAHNTLSQLADELQILESNYEKQSKKAEWSFRISIVGTILTIIFGIVSLLPTK